MVSYTIAEVAEELRVSRQMVYNLIRRGELEAFKVGSSVRVLDSDLRSYVERQKQRYRMEHVRGPEVQSSSAHPLVLEEMTLRRGDFTFGPVSLTIPPAAVTAVTGPSGSGKSSLLRGIKGLDALSAGRVWLGPVNLSDLAVEERRIGFVFQESTLFPEMTMRENLEFPLRVRRASREELDDGVRAVAAELGIDPAHMDRYGAQLPAGVKQLFAIGKGRIHMLDLLLMDEPLQHLPAAEHREIRLLVQKLVRWLGKTVLTALNDPEDVLAMSDYTAVLEEGRLVEFGPTDRLYRRPRTRQAMELLSPLGLNRIPVRVAGERVQQLDLPAPGCEDGEWELCFRPEDALAEGGYRLPFGWEKKLFYDRSRVLVEGTVAERRVSLLLPHTAGELSTAGLRDFRVFPREEEESGEKRG